jgi:tellurite resistance protein TerC
LHGAQAAQAVSLFPFAEYWWFYAGFTAFVLVLLALDLGVFHRDAHSVSIKEAGIWTVVWVSMALAFNVGLYFWLQHRLPLEARLMAIPGFDPAAAAQRTALEFLAGYVMEYSLSVDNIFVFVVVLNYFAIPLKYQHRVLFFGILGALIFRAIFIAIGALLIQYQWVVWIFGAFLIFTGVKMMSSGEGEVEPEENAIIKAFKRAVPVTHELREQAFFVVENGKRAATPMFIALLFLEMTDIVFAVDSVPAIFGITHEPLIVFTSNIFAILGLRNLYFLLRGAIDKFHLLKYGLGIVLIFVGSKMTFLWRFFPDKHFPIEWSLGIIVGVLAISIVASLLVPQKPGEHAQPGLPPGADLFLHEKGDAEQPAERYGVPKDDGRKDEK